MIDPNNQNNQNNQALPVDGNLISNQQPQNQGYVPNDQQSDSNNTNHNISSGKPELGPLVDANANENQDFENQPIVESSGEFADPNVGREVKDMVKVKKDFPEIDDSAKQAGITETIPTGPVYGNFPTSLATAQADYDKKPSTSADKWRALEAIKALGRNLLGQTKASEV